MSDSDRISQLEKDIREIKNKIKKDKRDTPDYKKKKPTEYNTFIKKFCESAKAKEGDEYDHKKTLANIEEHIKTIKVMQKFTKFESSIIINSLNLGLGSDLSENQLVVEAGKNPIMTADYIQMIYVDLIGKVEEMTKKK